MYKAKLNSTLLNEDAFALRHYLLSEKKKTLHFDICIITLNVYYIFYGFTPANTPYIKSYLGGTRGSHSLSAAGTFILGKSSVNIGLVKY